MEIVTEDGNTVAIRLTTKQKLSLEKLKAILVRAGKDFYDQEENQ